MTYPQLCVSAQDATGDESRHSPWELFRPGVEVDQAAKEAPALGSETAEYVAAVAERLLGLSRFAAYADVPDPAEKWIASGFGRFALSPPIWVLNVAQILLKSCVVFGTCIYCGVQWLDAGRANIAG